MTTAKKTYPCPECEHKGITKVYNDAAHLGIHRRVAHGIPGASKNAAKARALHKAAKAAEEAKPADQPMKRKYTKRSTALAPIEKDQASPTNGHHPAAPTYRPFHAEAALAVAFGRFKEVCTSIAVEYDLPPRSFAAELAKLIYAETVR